MRLIGTDTVTEAEASITLLVQVQKGKYVFVCICAFMSERVGQRQREKHHYGNKKCQIAVACYHITVITHCMINIVHLLPLAV